MRSAPGAGRSVGGRVALVLVAGSIVCSLVGAGVATVLRGGEEEERGGGDGGEADEPGGFELSLREAIATNPSDAAAMASLANLLATVGEREEAVDWYERTLVLRPGDDATRLNFATTLAESGQRADAELQFRRLVASDPGNVEATFYLAELLRGWEPTRGEEARVLYERVVGLAPDAYLSERAREELGRLPGAAGAASASPAAVIRGEERG